MIRKLFYLALLIGLISVWALSDTLFPPEVINAPNAKVRDGDTLSLNGHTQELKEEKIFRLYGIDAPEYRQMCKDANGKDWPCGKAARAQLEAFVLSGSIKCIPQAQDRYGRSVARCSSATVPDLSHAMVHAGLAVSPEASAPERIGSNPYADAQDQARTAKRGIWQGAFVMPDQYRSTNPRTP
jgi:endonuclease YncB( thermonuclease family)